MLSEAGYSTFSKVQNRPKLFKHAFSVTGELRYWPMFEEIRSQPFREDTRHVAVLKNELICEINFTSRHLGLPQVGQSGCRVQEQGSNLKLPLLLDTTKN